MRAGGASGWNSVRDAMARNAADRVVAPQRARHRTQLRECAQQAQEGVARLPLAASQRALAGPAERRQPRAPRIGPRGGRLRCGGRRDGGAPARGDRVVAARGQRPDRRAERHRTQTQSPPFAFATGARHPCGVAIGQVRRAQHERRAGHRQRTAHPIDQRQRAGHQRNVGQRRAERNGVRPRRVGRATLEQFRTQHVLGHGQHFVAPLVEIRDHDADACRGIGQRAFARERQRRDEFGLRRGGRHANAPPRARLRQLDDRQRASGRLQRIEQSLLLRREFEKAGQHELRVAPRGHGGRRGREHVGELRRVGEAALGERLGIAARPSGKGRRVVLDARPAPSGGRFAGHAPGVERPPRVRCSLRGTVRIEQHRIAFDDAVPEEGGGGR